MPSQGGAGDQFWLLTSRVDDGSFYANYDGFRIIWDNDPGNSTSARRGCSARTPGDGRGPLTRQAGTRCPPPAVLHGGRRAGPARQDGPGRCGGRAATVTR